MRFRVLDADDPEDLARWRALWDSWPGREVMARPEYARLFARPCDRVVCALGEGERRTLLFPMLLRPCAAEPWAEPEDGRLDAITPYGYGGPFAWGDGAADDAAFWAAHAAWCREEGIVSTFVRLSLFPGQLAPMPWPVVLHSANVVVPLEGGAGAIWDGYASNVRRSVRRCQRAGLEVVVDREGSRLDDFFHVYTATMKRRGASSFYFFPRSTFERLRLELAGHHAFFHGVLDGQVISSDLVLCSADRVYYFLGGTLDAALPLSPSYLVKHHVAVWAAAQGKGGYVLGGGHRPGDGLLRHKRGFAPYGEVPFRIACIVHDLRGYDELARARARFEARAERHWAPSPAFFPAYRA